MKNRRSKSPRSSKRRPAELQRMGGKEERTSLVGRARAEVERSEKKGDARFDIAPGPEAEELQEGNGRRAVPPDEERLPAKQVSPKPRGGPEGLEPEDRG